MYIDQREINGATVLDLCGRFDETDHNKFMNVIEDLQVRGCRHIVVNLSSLYFLDPLVINLLHFSHEYFHEFSGDLVLVSPLSSVRNELNLANVSNTIPIYASVYDALHRRHASTRKLSTAMTA